MWQFFDWYPSFVMTCFLLKCLSHTVALSRSILSLVPQLWIHFLRTSFSWGKRKCLIFGLLPWMQPSTAHVFMPGKKKQKWNSTSVTKHNEKRSHTTKDMRQNGVFSNWNHSKSLITVSPWVITYVTSDQANISNTWVIFFFIILLYIHLVFLYIYIIFKIYDVIFLKEKFKRLD